jgi:hypothetical protein
VGRVPRPNRKSGKSDPIIETIDSHASQPIDLDGVPVFEAPARRSATVATAPLAPALTPIAEEIRRVIDWNKPEEIARRSEEATAVMRKMIPHGHPKY